MEKKMKEKNEELDSDTNQVVNLSSSKAYIKAKS